MKEKVQALCDLITKDSIEDLQMSGLDCETNVNNASAFFIEKRKYFNIDTGRGSGRYMVDKENGHIYGIKAYGQINRKHLYGTLETIHEYFWGAYHANRKPKAA